MKKRLIRILTSIIIVILSIVIVLYALNDTGITVTPYYFSSEKINGEITVLQISDFHNHGDNYNGVSLNSLIDEINPDLVLLTGDIIDDKCKNLDEIIVLFEKLKDYKTYYVTGNHEATAPLFYDMLDLFPIYNINYLDNQRANIIINNQNINILGISDPRMEEKEIYLTSNTTNVKEHLDLVTENMNSDYSILLCHRPDLFTIVKDYDIDIVFTGHTHAGEIAIFGQALFVPNQGLFPKYDYGQFYENNTNMIISSGAGSSSLNLHVGTKMEIVVAYINGL